MPAQDVAYMWLRCRMETMEDFGDEIYLKTPCRRPGCKGKIEEYFNLADMEFDAYRLMPDEEFSYPSFEFRHRILKRIKYMDQAVDCIKFTLPRWSSMKSFNSKLTYRRDLIEKWEFENSIEMIMPQTQPYSESFWRAKGMIKPVRQVLMKVASDIQAGSDWVTQLECPDCMFRFYEPIDFMSPNFFGIGRI